MSKVNLLLTPDSAIVAITRAFEDGNRKYGGMYTWRDSEKYQTVSLNLAAARRHMAEFFSGTDVAEDSGVCHIAHAAARLCMILDLMACGKLIDDRRGFVGLDLEVDDDVV